VVGEDPQAAIKVTGAPEPSSPSFTSKLPGPAPSAMPGATSAALTVDNGAGDPALTIGVVAVLALVGGLALGVLAAIVLGLGRVAARR
jgi:hypothetical protein